MALWTRTGAQRPPGGSHACPLTRCHLTRLSTHTPVSSHACPLTLLSAHTPAHSYACPLTRLSIYTPSRPHACPLTRLSTHTPSCPHSGGRCVRLAIAQASCDVATPSMPAAVSSVHKGSLLPCSTCHACAGGVAAMRHWASIRLVGRLRTALAARCAASSRRESRAERSTGAPEPAGGPAGCADRAFIKHGLVGNRAVGFCNR